MPHLRPISDPTDYQAIYGLRPSVRVAVVAKTLDMDPSEVRRLARGGELEGHRVGVRGIRIYVDSVEDYQNRRKLGRAAANQDTAPPRRKNSPSAADREAMAALAAMGVRI